MNTQRKNSHIKQGIEKALIIVFCVVIAVCVVGVMLFSYRPEQNALGAFATVCMDVICLLILILLVVNLTFEKSEIGRTTGLFLGLMLVTMLAMFFDFLTWSSDGLLEYGELTYVYTVSSLCCGSILAGVFVLYLCSYLNDMYDMKRAFRMAKLCIIINAFAFFITVILAFSGKAFVLVDGHYQTGALYDMVTALPVLTLLIMTGYSVVHVKTIGIHDLIAVVGYISIMITGALVESEFRIGTTYVSVAVADIFIFVMLQNKLIDRVREQREVLAEEITSQYEILDSMARIYSYVNLVDLEESYEKRFDIKDGFVKNIDMTIDPHSSLNKRLYTGIEDELKKKFLVFTDLSTLSERMAKEKIISAEFCHAEEGWFRAQYIRIGDSTDEPIKKVIYAIRNIDEEKKNVEKWIKKSNTDELTGFYNRHAYEDEITSLGEKKLKDNFVYVSIDVNSLKIVNDSKGHEAGDELIVGACECMKQCYGSYGKLFRTGGDEFVALIFADEAQLNEIKKDIEEVTENWHGKLVDGLAISCGYVTKKDAGDMSLRQMAVLADKRMYENKNKYYQKKGIDRRGQRDAHVALCALYTKILKVNITDDTYQIINMADDEKVSEKGFADTISKWLHDFGTSGQVHPDDLEQYLKNTNLEYISNFFKNSKDSLCVFYRRKHDEEYIQVMMEMIPANDYSDEMQNLFLYVKNIESKS